MDIKKGNLIIKTIGEDLFGDCIVIEIIDGNCLKTICKLRAIITPKLGADDKKHPHIEISDITEARQPEEECTCPQECDCQSPPTHISNSCPIHNINPDPNPECPLHSKDY